MSEKTPELPEAPESPEPLGASTELREEGSLLGSAQAINLAPSEDFIAPTMSLDSIEAEPED